MPRLRHSSTYRVEIALQNVVLGGKAELLSGAVDGGRRSFQFEECSDRGFIPFDEQAFGPVLNWQEGETSCGIFRSETSRAAPTFEDFCQGDGASHLEFQFFAHLVALAFLLLRRNRSHDSIAERPLEGEQSVR